MALHPDGRHLVITNNGWSKPSLRVVDLERRQVTQRMALDHAWLGVAWHPDGKRLFSSGAADNSIREVEWRSEQARPRPHLHPGAAPEGRLRGRHGQPRLRGRPRPLPGRAASSTPPRSTARRSRPSTSRRASVLARAALDGRGLRRGRAADGECRLRLRVGRLPRGRPRAAHPPAPRRDRGGRAPERDGVLEGREAPLRRLRQHERGVGGGPGEPQGRRADRGRPLAAGPAGLDAERSRALPRRRHPPRRQRRQQHGGRRGRHAARREPLPGLHPHRLVPDRRLVRPRGESASSS